MRHPFPFLGGHEAPAERQCISCSAPAEPRSHLCAMHTAQPHAAPYPDSHEAHDELPQTEMHFDGETYEHDADGKRLGEQLSRVCSLMTCGRWAGAWWTLHQIHNATGFPEASISARLRDLRKPRFGEHTVERRRRAGRGTWEYRVSRGG